MKFVWVGQRFVPIEEPPPIRRAILERRASRIWTFAILARLNQLTFPGAVNEEGDWDGKLSVINKELEHGLELELWKNEGKEKRLLCRHRSWNTLHTWLEGFECAKG